MPKTVLRALFFGLLTATFMAPPERALAQIDIEHGRFTQNEYTQQLRLAMLYEENRDWTSAHRIYETLYKQKPDNAEALDGYLRALEALKRYAEAETVITEGIARHGGGQIEIYLLLARMQAKQGKKDAALGSYQLAEERSGEITECSMLLPIAFGLVDVSYKNEAIEMLERIEQLDKEGNFCAGQVASLYLRLAEYGKAAKQYLKMVDAGEAHLGIVQQRLAQYTQDSISRKQMLEAFKHEIGQDEPTVASLQLLGWFYGEVKDYEGAFSVIKKIDDMTGEKMANRGYEMLMFAERARSEGALEVSVKAYDEAIKRLRVSTTKHNQFFVEQAELGALRTHEAFALSKDPIDPEQVRKVVARYETFGQESAAKEYGLEAYLRAGELSLEQLFDLAAAERNYGKVVASKLPTVRTRDAMFGLVDVAIAKGDLVAAGHGLSAIETTLDKRPKSSDKDVRNRVAYMKALVDYYRGGFDTAAAQLAVIIEDPASDYANDAISLNNTLLESTEMPYRGSLELYAKAQLAEATRNFDQALSHYRTIVTTYGSAPLADDAILRTGEVLAKQKKFAEAVAELEQMQEKMMTSPIADQAQFRLVEIIERDLKDKPRAQQLYEDFLVRYPKSMYAAEARERARRLRGDVF